jgi:hypothetical protein
MYAQRNLHFPCSGCVHLLCVPLLCVSALCACVWCACAALACPRFASQSARLHRTALVDVADITSLEDPGDLTCLPTTLTPFQSHRIALTCPYACAGNTVLRASYMHPTVNRIALVCPYTCACNGVLRAPPFKAPSKAHLLIPFKGLIPLIFINSVVPGVDLITSSGWPNYFGCQYSTLSLLLPPSGANTPVPDLPSLFTAPAPVRPFSLPSFSVHAPTCLHCQTQKMPRRL